MSSHSPMTRSRSRFQSNPVDVDDDPIEILPQPKVETPRKPKQFSGISYSPVAPLGSTDDSFMHGPSNLNFVVAVI